MSAGWNAAEGIAAIPAGAFDTVGSHQDDAGVFKRVTSRRVCDPAGDGTLLGLHQLVRSGQDSCEHETENTTQTNLNSHGGFSFERE